MNFISYFSVNFVFSFPFIFFIDFNLINVFFLLNSPPFCRILPKNYLEY